MADIMAAENVASSSGYIGAQALEKSYERKDFSRNPLYNQAKMYAEVYRFMGWIVSNENSALQFHFTFLGVHIATAGVYSGKLFEQSLLGISYPNQILDVKFNDRNKPFVSILKAVSGLNGEICRDEILIGPMNLSNGYDPNEILKLSEKIIEIRTSKDYSRLQSELQKLSKVLGIKLNTMKNYTRFVISALVYSGWFTKENSNVYGVKKGFLKITKKGINLVNQLKESESIDGNELYKQSPDVIKNISKLAFIQMLERAGFVVEEELSEMDTEIQTALNLYGKKEIFFSPYQFFNKETLVSILPEYTVEEGEELIEPLGLSLALELGDTLELDELLKLKLGLKLILELTDTLGLALIELLGLCEALTELLGLELGLALTELLGLGEALGLELGLALTELLGLGDRLILELGDNEGLVLIELLGLEPESKYFIITMPVAPAPPLAPEV